MTRTGSALGLGAVGLAVVLLAVPGISPRPQGAIALAAGPTTGPVPIHRGTPAAAPPNASFVLNWTNYGNATTGGTPGARAYPGFVYDPADGVSLLYGGEAANGTALGDTWTLGSRWNWSALAPVPSPSPRWGSAMAYDATSGSVVLFGGAANNTTDDQDTWSYRNGSWSQLAPAVVPPARAFALLLPSPNGSGLLLFGGNSSTFGRLNGTWYYHLGSWTQLSPTTIGNGPSPRSGAAGTFLPDPSEDVVFGGDVSLNATHPRGPGDAAGDTWLYNATGWVNVTATLPNPPGRREGASMVYDPTVGSALLVGGASSVAGSFLAVWSFNGSGWFQVPLASATHPSVRVGAGFTASNLSGRSVVLLFGGGSGSNASTFRVFQGLWSIGIRAPLVVPAPSASRPSVDSGFPVNLSATPIGGVAPFAYHWTGLPLPCANTTTSAPTCRPISNLSVATFFRPRVTVTDTLGSSVVSASGSVSINAPLRVDRVLLSPIPVAVGTPLTVNVTVSGGGVPLRFVYVGLPPGCVSENLSTFTCVPSGAGTFDVNVTVTDTFGIAASSIASIDVAGPGLGIVQVGGFALALVGGAAVAAVLLRGRGRRPRSPASAGPGPSTAPSTPGGPP